MADANSWSEMLQERIGLVPAAAATAGAVLYYMLSRSRPPVETTTVSLNNQSIELEPGMRTSHFAPDGNVVKYYYEDAKTCYEVFTRGIRVSNNGPCLGARTGSSLEYEWLSYQEVYDHAQMLGSAFIGKGVEAVNDTYIGIFANNCPEWVITEQACNMFSMVSVPLYDTLGDDACAYIINQTGMELIMCDKAVKAERLLKKKATPSVRVIVVIEDITPSLRSLARTSKVELVTFSEMIKLGKDDLRPVVPPQPDDLATICYTSGTTGNPKGVMLTHESLCANTAAMLYAVPNALNERDVYMSYLPLAHMFEGICQCMMFQHGARIGFFRGDVKLLTEDMQALRPTIFPVVPRLLNRIYDKVMMGIKDSAIKSFLFNLALRQKLKLLKQGVITNTSIWDKLVFKKVQKLLGGRLRIAITGSAPVSADVLNFTRCAFGCMVFEGYGQTEAVAGICATMSNENQPGPVGPPLSCNVVKLVDVEEMGYFVSDNKGEVCSKGSNNMKGYFKDEEKTREAIDEDGWLHTGDIGQWQPNGTLKIIDRKKHIFKLAQGEYLAPEKIEMVYVKSSLVAQVFVDGNGLHPFPVAIVVPDEETLPGWAKTRGIAGSFSELCAKLEVEKAILEDMVKEGKAGGLKGFEQVKSIHLHPELFSVENGLLTPTFKAKRPVLRKFFAEKIEELYTKASS